LDKYLQNHPTGYHPFASISSTSNSLTSAADKSSSVSASTTIEPESDTDDESEDDMKQLNEFPSPPPPGFTDPSSFTQDQLEEFLVLMKSRGIMGGKTRVVPLGVSFSLSPYTPDYLALARDKY
jgi:arginine-tRNA-protein transferase